MFPGTQRLTASGVVGVSGRPVRVFFADLLSGATASTCTLRNGTSGSGTAYSELDGTANIAVIKNYAGGMLFPDGCYLSMDVNATSVTVGYILGPA